MSGVVLSVEERTSARESSFSAPFGSLLFGPQNRASGIRPRWESDRGGNQTAVGIRPRELGILVIRSM